jgi:phage shock protein A
MANPVAISGSLPAPALKGGAAADGVKAQPSQFDKVAEAVRDRQSGAATLPPAVTGVSDGQKRVLVAELRKKMEQTGAKTPQQLFQRDLNKTGANIDALSKRVDALPKTPTMEPIRTRLASIEKQFQATSGLVSSTATSNSPGDLLKMQVQMYQLTQNVEIVSKVVDEVNSGVKQILQTQVS